MRDYIWSVANHLVKNSDFSLVNIKEKTDTSQDIPNLHIIKNNKREYIYIRLVPVNFLWPNHLNNDMVEAENYAVNLLKQMFGQKMRFLNLYIFQQTPSVEIQQLISQEARKTKKSLEFYTGYVDLEYEKIGLPEATFTDFRMNKEAFMYQFNTPNLQDANQSLDEMKSIEYKRQKEIKSIFNFGKPIITYTFLAIIVLIYLLMAIKGGGTDKIAVLLDFGAKEAFLISQGEYWRIITAIFLHNDLLHLSLNGLALYYLGKITEQIYGSLRFFWVYLLAGITGNIFSIIFMPESIGVGASGAIYGLFGALLYFGYVYPDLFFRTMGKDVISILAINVIFSLAVQNVDIYAHLGGLVGGFLVAAIISLPNERKKTIKLKVVSISSLIIILVAGWWGLNIREFEANPYIYTKADEAIADGELDKAYQIYANLTKSYPDEPYFHYQYANIVLQQGDLNTASNHYKIALDLEPSMYEAHYKLALIYNFELEYNSAIYHLNKALEIKPDYKEAMELLNNINSKQGS